MAQLAALIEGHKLVDEAEDVRARVTINRAVWGEGEATETGETADVDTSLAAFGLKEV